MKTNTTQKSVDELRARGYLTANVEKFNFYTKRKNDLYGFIDIMAIKKGKTLAVQTTSGRENAFHRIKKIEAHENYPKVKEAGWKIEVHGWRKLKKKNKDGSWSKKGCWKNKITKL